MGKENNGTVIKSETQAKCKASKINTKTSKIVDNKAKKTVEHPKRYE